MKAASSRNLSASVKARLLQIARDRSVQLQRVLIQYAIERLLYRLTQSQYADRFVLKGAVLVSAWEGGGYRPTKDLDLLGRLDSEPEALAEVFRHILRAEVEGDGLWFDPESVTADTIFEEAQYPGVRVRLLAHLGKARIPMQVDIGFGDPITPGMVTVEFPGMLDFPAPVLQGYPPETVVAEKYETLVRLGMRTSRIKDVYDLWYLSMDVSFEGRVLRDAIENSFRARQTLLPSEAPIALTREFEDEPSKQALWRAFVDRAAITQPQSLGEALAVLREFLLPVGLSASTVSNGRWPPGGPW